MHKKSMLLGFVIVMVLMVVAINAYAGGDAAVNNCPVHGFFESLGGFLYNALPWNWGNWWGK